MAVGDEYRYLNGNTYIETDGGPLVYGRCFHCGATALTRIDIRMADVLCGRCLANKHEMLPGQRNYISIQQWQANPANMPGRPRSNAL